MDRAPIFPTHLVAVSSADQDAAEKGERRRANGIRWTSLEGRPLITLSKEEVNVNRRIVVGHLQTAVAMAAEGLGTAVMPSFGKHMCRHYRVRIDRIRPEVALSFYRITRVDRDTLAVLDQFTEMFTETAQEPTAGGDDDGLD